MKRRIAAFCIGMVVLIGAASPAPAFNPQPEPPAMVNRLNAVVRNLVEIRIRLNVALAHPPEPGMPGVEGQFNAMAGRLKILSDRMNGALHPPEPGDPLPYNGRVLDALLNIRDQALGIVSDIRKSVPPDDPRVLHGLDGVMSSAQAIIDLATDYIVSGKKIDPGD